MTKNILIVESPAKAKTINKYLGSDYEVLASYGHIRDLPSKNGSVDPSDNFKMIYELNPYSQKHLDKIISAAKGAEKILLATDPDREGEAIAWHIVEVLKQKKAISKTSSVERVVFTEITKKAVTDAIKNSRHIDQNLVNAQQARRALDYLVGFGLSPILWRKLPGSRSAGRVQSVALKLVAQRDEEIEKFISREFWSINIDFLNIQNQPFSAYLIKIDNNKLEKFDINDEKYANELIEDLKKNKFKITEIEKKQINRKPSAPFITSTLQQEASRKLNFAIKKTMKVAQELYEGIKINNETVGLITYMRTDGTQISLDAIDKTRELILNKYGKEYLPSAANLYQSKVKNAQEAHEAIRPTDVKRLPKELSEFLTQEQYALYDLIWKRLVSSQMEMAKSELTTADITSDDNKFTLRATGTVPIFDGFRKVYTEDKDDNKDEAENQLPPLKKEDPVKAQKFIPTQHFTEAPPRYSEASLVKKMEELGIGRPSTYATIISVIQERQYVRLDKKRFYCEDRGRVVNSFVNHYFSKYVEYDFTADLENKLDIVSSGELDYIVLLNDFWKHFDENIEKTKITSNPEVIDVINENLAHHFFPQDQEGKDSRACPECKTGKLSIKPGKFGIFIACSNYPDCKYTRQISDNKDGQEENTNQENVVLGTDPESSDEVILKKGPYGFYVQLGIGKNPKRTSIPQGIKLEEVDLAQALALLSLPRNLGNDENGNMISAGIGRYGPFILVNGKYHSLHSDNVLTIAHERALEIINTKANPTAAKGKLIGSHKGLDDEIYILSGRYGPYLKCGKKNIPIPKKINIEIIDEKMAIEIIDKFLAK